MDLKRLPFLPINFFYFQFGKPVRWLFVFLFGTLLLAAALFYHAQAFPEFWSLEIQEVTQNESEQLPIHTIEKNYREIPLSFNVYRQWTSYLAGPLLPHALPVSLFILFQFLGWTMVLAVASLIRSRWAYLFYLLFALFIHFTDVVRIMYPADAFHLLEFVVIASYLGLAYSFQMNYIRWKLPLRWLTFLALSGLYVGLAYLQGGWLAFHKMSVDTYPYLLVVGLAFVVFVAKEPTNLVMVAANNRKFPRHRLKAMPILGLYLLLLLIELVPFLHYAGLAELPVTDLGISPAMLLVIAAVFTVFTSQNQFFAVKRILSSNTAFTFLLLSWALISLSFFFLPSSEGDAVFIYALNRFTAEIFFGVAVMHVFFIYTNFYELLKARINLYYLMAQGRRFGFIIVSLFGLIVLVFAEGHHNWRSFRLFFHSLAVQYADHDLLNAKRQDAIASYQVALEMSPTAAKANYNLASLLIGDPQAVNEALKAYERASQRSFAYARLNAANVLLVNQEREKALKVLQDGLDEGNAYLANNLGLLYRQLGQPDSAIQSFKLALRQNPDLSAVYSNLGLLYLEHEKTKEATDFLEAALSVKPPAPAAITNAIYLSLKTGKRLLSPAVSLSKEADFAQQYNYLIYLMADRQWEAAFPLAEQLSEDGTAFDAQIAAAYLLFRRDSVPQAMSKVAYLAQSSVAPLAEANFMLGAAFYERGIPEMARRYFRLAGEYGLPQGQLYAAKTAIDLGMADSAQEELTIIRVEHPPLWDEASRELAMLLKAYGQDAFAQVEWDLSALSTKERMRISLYADSLGQYVIAENNFREILQQDSSYILPYLEMGRIYNKYGDELAILNLQTGLAKDSASVPLRQELARAYLLQGQGEQAAILLKHLPQNAETLTLSARLALQKADSSQALDLLLKAHQQDPLRQETILLLFDLLRQQNNWDAANDLITRALQANTENPGLWYAYALSSKNWNLLEDAGFGAAKAIELTHDEKRKQQIAKEFEAELRLLANEPD